MPGPAIYEGTLRHRRFTPRRHEFRYSLFMALLEIDSIADLMRRCPFTSYNRFNWAAFAERDHFGDPALPLRRRLEADARLNGVAWPGGPVYLLTHLRYLGYCFNPISLFFCYGGESAAPAVMAEVNSTFGESRNYWLGPHNAIPSRNSLRFTCPKSLRVSPFLPMHLDYEFTLTEPAERLAVHIAALDAGRTVLDATLTLERREWTAANMARALVRQPFMTGKVIAAIHWQALRLYLKGVA